MDNDERPRDLPLQADEEFERTETGWGLHVVQDCARRAVNGWYMRRAIGPVRAYFDFREITLAEAERLWSLPAGTQPDPAAYVTNKT